MEFLKEALGILSNQCESITVKRKQKLLAKLVQSFLTASDIPATLTELKECLESICNLHLTHTEEPGNIIVTLLRLEKFPGLSDYITSEQLNVVNDERIDSFLQVLSDKLKSHEILQKIDTITKYLIDIKNLDNDSEIVSRYEKLIHKEYLESLKRKDTDENTEIKITQESSEEYLTNIIHTISVTSKQRTRLPSGIQSLDRHLLPGFEATRVYVFGGRPGLGKSSLILNFFLNAVLSSSENQTRKDKKQDIVVYITLENDIIETFERIIRITTKSPVTMSSITNEELNEIALVIKQQYRNGLFVKYMNPYTTTTMDVFLLIDRLSEEYNIIGVFVDYLNLLSSSTNQSRKLEKRFELGMITAELKVIAKRFQCPVITPAQLNTAGYEGIPTMKNLDESRQIAQNADFIGLMFQYPIEKLPPRLVYLYPEEKYSFIGINIDKNRNGPTGLIFLLGHREIYSFTPLESNTERELKQKILFGDRNINRQNNGQQFLDDPTKLLNTPFQ